MQRGIILVSEHYFLHYVLFFLTHEKVSETSESEGTSSQHEGSSP